jgi:hypothetical protein
MGLFVWMCTLVSTAQAQGQVTVKGTVFNMYRTAPLEAVSVVSTSGKFTMTDSNGHYSMLVDPTDSISFSYLGKSTIKFPATAFNPVSGMDIELHVNTELSEVKVAPRNYHMDSLRNREEYERVFDFKKPGLSITQPGQGLGVGLDLDAIINMFRFTRTRRMLAFQKRLVEEEQDKFIDHRFNAAIVKKITHLEGDQLDTFMVKYRPSYDFTRESNDYEFFQYIKLAYGQYKESRRRSGEMKRQRE